MSVFQTNELREKYQIPSDAVITIAGMVGVGKSTFTKALAGLLGFRVSYEKVDNNPYLDRFYDDLSRWGFHLQIFFLAERFKEQKRIFDYGGGFVQDRSIYEDTGIFAKMLHDQGNMTDEDYQTYTQLFEAMVMTPYFPHPDVLISLEGSFEDIIDRIQERGRPMEQQTPLSYWKDLYARYDEWITNFTSCPVLRVNINEYDVMDDINSVEVVLARLSDKINTARHYRR
ncbi:deoxynucleoside kinase [Brevibacillus laterosporus]|uniref:Deoxyadenosine/deoxycytidine kinase n=1 Tax=Brevibacillus laterosporus LMG 15441 TaxID=1042163 RepID=A0A075R304_BRELA|nr:MULTISPECIES: deoxynucleoside kinase [Brevibacillus]AIG25801.1 deoxyadenosine/deoxycytidine kinase [Brevibacillus laterosporus LMG 15441]ERM18439.1 deoxycytidine kinase [Brevibacillus laterosporus PE36]MCR8964719.1 deoxynucleoside kinase [Brevibacillus laterosporus]MCZ0836874.1 deoxynucleoside kinase [Brevibacillus halotolerans]RJL12832.1 deoxynucleoside kinase [Brevibacillus laterosporus]